MFKGVMDSRTGGKGKLLNIVLQNKYSAVLTLSFALYLIFSIIFFAYLHSKITFQEYQLSLLLQTRAGDTGRASADGGSQFTDLTSNINAMSEELMGLRRENENLRQQVFRQEQERLSVGNYENLQRLIVSSESALAQIRDYDEMIRVCDYVIQNIDQYMASSNDRGLINASSITKYEWLNRKRDFQIALESLIQKLDELLLARARNAADSRRSFASIDDISMTGREQNKNNNAIHVAHTYSVRMKGMFLGSITEFEVTVTGFINLYDDSITVMQEARIYE